MVEQLPENALAAPPGTATRTVHLHLTPDVLPIKPYLAFEDTLDRILTDPLNGLLSALRTARGGGVSSSVTLSIRPATDRRIRHSIRVLARLRRSFPLIVLQSWHWRACTHPRRSRRFFAWLLARLSRTADTILPEGEQKLSQHLFEAWLQISVSAPTSARDQADRCLAEITGAFGRFTSARTNFTMRRTNKRRLAATGRGFLLTAQEIATLWHPPVSGVKVERLERCAFREMEPPNNLPTTEANLSLTHIGRVRFRQQRRHFGIQQHDLRRHLFLCGRTGTGKSTLIKTMIMSDIHAARNVCLIDPHGDLVDDVLDAIPPRRTNDVILFDASDRDNAVSFNPLACRHADLRPLLTDGLVSAFKRLYGESWGPRLEQLLRNGLLLLLERQNATLIDLQRLLTDKPFRTSLVDRSSDPVVRAFWRDTFGRWNDRFQTEATSPVLNKLDGFLSSPVARLITCQRRNAIDLRMILDNPRSIFLCNLCKGLTDEETSSLLGSFLVAALQTAALSRADTSECDRTDVHVYIDEFHSFVSQGNTSFSTILSESRKYHVAFAALATQFLDQIDEDTLNAVLGNCGSNIVFRCGVRDAETLAMQLGGDVAPQDILGLPNFAAYAQLLVDGETTDGPFSMTTLPAVTQVRGRADIVRKVSNQRYTRSASEVNEEIERAYR